jgi:ferrochelatase
VEEVIIKLAERGVSQAVVSPFGFVADQVEILYDLDVTLKRKAQQAGVAVVRAPLLNDGPAVIDSLALLVDEWRA